MLRTFYEKTRSIDITKIKLEPFSSYEELIKHGFTKLEVGFFIRETVSFSTELIYSVEERGSEIDVMLVNVSLDQGLFSHFDLGDAVSVSLTNIVNLDTPLREVKSTILEKVRERGRGSRIRIKTSRARIVPNKYTIHNAIGIPHETAVSICGFSMPKKLDVEMYRVHMYFTDYEWFLYVDEATIENIVDKFFNIVEDFVKKILGVIDVLKLIKPLAKHRLIAPFLPNALYAWVNFLLIDCSNVKLRTHDDSLEVHIFSNYLDVEFEGAYNLVVLSNKPFDYVKEWVTQHDERIKQAIILLSS